MGLIQGNSIAGNSGGGLVNNSAATVIASGNWWGDANGPTTTTLNTYAYTPDRPTTGDAVTGISTVAPWLTDGTDTDTNTPGFQPSALDSTAPTVTLDSTIVTDTGVSFDGSCNQ